MSGYACVISIASHGLDCKKNLRLCRHSNLNNPIQFVLEDVASLLNIFQLIAVSDQRGGIDLACFDESEDLSAVAAVDTAGFEGQVLAIHIRQRLDLSLFNRAINFVRRMLRHLWGAPPIRLGLL